MRRFASISSKLVVWVAYKLCATLLAFVGVYYLKMRWRRMAVIS
jgi:hypothetical protein